MKNATIDYLNPTTVRQEGIKALTNALSPVGMAYFFRQIESGEGNYTDEKDDLTKHFSTASVMEELKRMRK